jgi:hypothetical protein
MKLSQNPLNSHAEAKPSDQFPILLQPQVSKLKIKEISTSPNFTNQTPDSQRPHTALSAHKAPSTAKPK